MLDANMRRVGSEELLPAYQSQNIRADRIAQAGIDKIKQDRTTGPLDPKWLLSLEEGPGTYGRV